MKPESVAIVSTSTRSGVALSGEAVRPTGKALGWKAEGPRFDPLRLSFLFSSKMVVYGHCLVTLPTQLIKA